MHDPYYFAIRKTDGKRVSIADLSPAERGLNCGCICSGCHADLQARMGTKNRWHFAHTSKGCDATKVNVTGLYQFVFEYLSEKRTLLLPTVGLVYDAAKDGIPITKSNVASRVSTVSPYYDHYVGKPIIKEPIIWELKSPELSMSNEGYPEAIIDTAENSELALCIIPPKMVHKNVIPSEYRNLPTVILNLSEVDIRELSHQYLYESIMTDPSFFYWIHYPKAKQYYPNIYKESHEECIKKLHEIAQACSIKKK